MSTNYFLKVLSSGTGKYTPKLNKVTEEEEEEPILSHGEERCRVTMWRCMSKVVEGSLHYMDSPDGFMG